MLIFYAKSFLEQLEAVGRVERELEAGRDDRVGAAASQLKELGLKAGVIGLKSLEEHATYIFRLWSQENQLTREVALHECRSFRQALLREMERQLFVVVRAEDRPYFEGPRLSRTAAASFPAGDEELTEAGKCLALDFPTACVYHSMRALEIGLKAMAASLRVGYDNKTWGQIIRNIEDDLVARKQADPHVELCSEAATHFRFVKNAWRDHTMHARQNYSREQAKAILDHSASLLEDLSKGGIEQV